MNTFAFLQFHLPGSSPRTWGGSCSSSSRPRLSNGSSPRTWGGFFPYNSIYRQPAVHPHARGADVMARPGPAESSPVHPHARGADGERTKQGRAEARFIPTHVGRMPKTEFTIGGIAGSSPRTWGGCPQAGNYSRNFNGSSPRTWGGCRQISLHRLAQGGSSPRTWGGFYEYIVSGLQNGRFIPTHVGRMPSSPCPRRGTVRFIPTHVGRMYEQDHPENV